MADVKISALPAASTPLTGGEVLPIVQSGTTTKVAVSNLTAGLAGTATININGTVGATTATTGAFTSGTFSTTLAVTGLITASANGKFLLANGATTGQLIADLENSGGRLVFGVANSAGTAPISSSTAYSVILNSDSGTPIELAVSSVTRLKVTSTGAAVTGTLGVTGKITATAAGIDVPTSNLGMVSSGTYTPTLTNGTNIASSTAYALQYMRVGNTVTVGGFINIDTTATGTSGLRMSLPIASNFTSSIDAGGVGSRPSTAANDSWNMYAVSATDDIQIDGYSTTTAAENLFITLVYQVK